MIVGLAHSAVCVPDVDAAARWYSEVLGLRVLSPPYRMEGDAIERDMSELVPSPVVVKAAIVGTGDEDRVIELIEYPNVERTSPDTSMRDPSRPVSIVDPGLTHVGLVCDDLDATRGDLEERGVKFLTNANAEVAGLRTAWFEDPWGTVFILLEQKDADRPYWRQFGS
ncbi:MAG TPA: VOC family protein [Acidimicrobiales bacterium]|nr:VOC family protein [Acidimicrobiales bacterium]